MSTYQRPESSPLFSKDIHLSKTVILMLSGQACLLARPVGWTMTKKEGNIFPGRPLPLTYSGGPEGNLFRNPLVAFWVL